MAQLGDELQRLLLMADVERGGRLVEQQDRRLLRERPGEHHPLSFAAAQRTEQPLDERCPAPSRSIASPTIVRSWRLSTPKYDTYGVRPSST